MSRYLFPLLLLAGFAASAQQRTIAIVFGPAPEASLKPALEAVAPRALEWAKTPAFTVELRRTGLREGQEFAKFMQLADIRSALNDAALVASTASMDRFFDTLEIAVSSTARRPGDRSILVLLEVPPAGADAKARLRQIAETAKSSRVQILLLDLHSAPTKDRDWGTMASDSGGLLSSDVSQLVALLPNSAPPPGLPQPENSPSSSAAVAKHIVRTALFRTEDSRRSGSALGSMTGILLTEVPMSGLQFAAEGSSSSARVRVMQVVKNNSGESVWSAEKDIVVKSPTSRLAPRKAAALCFARQIKLPGGQYTLESTVDDQVRGVKVVSSVPLRATDTIPGLGASGVLFVKKMDRQLDVLQGDSIIQYDGIALMPVLEPVFPATVPFDLSVYFLFYPDIRGKRPILRVDLLQNGSPVSGTTLPFNDALRDDTRDGRGATAGEQKIEFPYLAKLSGVMLLAGSYEAKITIQQDTQTVTRSAPFRVVDKPSGQ